MNRILLISANPELVRFYIDRCIMISYDIINTSCRLTLLINFVKSYLTIWFWLEKTWFIEISFCQLFHVSRYFSWILIEHANSHYINYLTVYWIHKISEKISIRLNSFKKTWLTSYKYSK